MLHLKCKYAYKLMVYGIHASIQTLYLYDTHICLETSTYIKYV